MRIGSPEGCDHRPEVRSASAVPVPGGQTAPMDGDGIVEPVDGAGGRWFEELPVGLVVRHALTRTVTEADNLMFCALTHNPQPLHLDATFAAATEFGERLVNSCSRSASWSG